MVKKIKQVPVLHRVRMVIDTEVYAMDRNEAILFAQELVSNAVNITDTRVKRNWRPQAKEMLESGMSLRETARTLGVDAGNMSKTFPGAGWTKSEGHDFRKMQDELDSLPDHLEARP